VNGYGQWRGICIALFGILILIACQSTVSPEPTPVPTGTLGTTPMPTTLPLPFSGVDSLCPVGPTPCAPTAPTPGAVSTSGSSSRTSVEQGSDEISTSVTTSATQPLTITILYDNNAYDERLKAAWGFAALVTYQHRTLLFDTGGDGPALLGNMRALGIDPAGVEDVVLSHIHKDHTGGLGALLAVGARPVVYLLPSFPADFKRQVGRTARVVEVTPGQALSEGIFTTGEMGDRIREQALVIRTDCGLVVMTGCAHPGIVQIIARAQELFDAPVYLVVGGFHLRNKSKSEIATIIEGFRQMGVRKVAPCHCTGDRAIAMFASEYGDDFISAGVGRIITVEPSGVER